MFVRSAWGAFGGVLIACKCVVGACTSGTCHGHFLAVRCDVTIFLAFDAGARCSDIFMNFKGRSKVFKLARFYDEFVGGLGGFAKDLDIGVFLAVAPVFRVFDPVDMGDRILW
jgi:hypothetical protein